METGQIQKGLELEIEEYNDNKHCRNNKVSLYNQDTFKKAYNLL